MKQSARFLAIILLPLACTFLYGCKNETYLYCIGDEVAIRQSPNRESKKTGSLKQGDKVTLIEEGKTREKIKLDDYQTDRPWYRIKTSDGKTGWVYGGFLYKNLFTADKIGKSGYRIIGWNKKDMFTYVHEHENYMGDEPNYSLHIFDAASGTERTVVGRRRVDFVQVLRFLREQKKIPIDPYEPGFDKKYLGYYWGNSLQTFFYLNRYAIHEALESGDFVPVDGAGLSPLPVKCKGRTIEIKIDMRKKTDFFPGMIGHFDVVAIDGKETKKVLSKTGIFKNVKAKGFLTNPLTGNPVLVVEYLECSGYDIREHDFIGLH